MIKIISFKICPFVQRVTATLEARSLQYEVEYIELSDMPQWFLDISPTAQVPVLLTENKTALFESDAIVEYLDEITIPLEATISAEQRALDRAWSYQASKHYLVQCGAMSSTDEHSLNERADRLGKAFAKAEKQLCAGPYFNGDSFGNVDIAWLPLLHRSALIEQHTGYDFVSNYPKVKAWQNKLMATGLAEKSVSPDFEAIFAKFYLSDQTYLGSGKDGIDTSARNGSGGCCG